MGKTLIIKKYSNRRLYDTERSKYVTLNQIADLIREGRQIDVIDAKTEEDVTAYILTQIILDEARKKNVLLPVPLLHMIIQYGQSILGEFFEKYLQQTIQNYLAYKKAMDDQFKKWLDLGLDLSDLAQKTMKGLAPFHSFSDQFSKPEDDEENK